MKKLLHKLGKEGRWLHFQATKPSSQGTFKISKVFNGVEPLFSTPRGKGRCLGGLGFVCGC